MRKFFLFFVVLLLFIFLSGGVYTALASEQGEYYEYRVLHNSSKLYRYPSIAQEDVIILLNQTADLALLEVEPIAEGGYSFYKVNANGREGYILTNDVYYCRREYEHEIIYKRVVTPSLYGKATIYAYPDALGEKLAEVKDGQRISVVRSSGDYGDFEKIIYKEGYAYMQSSYLTKGLAKGQSTAVLIAGIIIASALTASSLLKLARKNISTKGQ